MGGDDWNRRGVAAALLAAVTGAPALAQDRRLTQVASQDPNAPPPASPGDEVALEADASRRMTTPVFLNDVGPIPFVVDTGANRTVLSETLAAELALPEGPELRVHGIAGPYQARSARLDRLRAGATVVSDMVTPLLPESGLGARGLLGIDVFRGKRVRFDFTANQLTIGQSRRAARGLGQSDRGTVRAAGGDIVVRARQRDGQLMIFDAETAGTRIVCFVDSGAATSVGNSALMRALAAVRNGLPYPPVDVLIRSATGQSARGQVARVPSMRIGGLNLTSFDLAFADLHTFAQWGLSGRPALLFGMDVLRIFEAVTLDFGASELVFRLRQNRG